MARFVVLEPEGATADDAIDNARIVRDGFSIIAFLVPPLWLAWHRLWVEAAVILAVLLALGLLGEHAGIGSVAPLLSVFVSVLVGLEGQSWLIARLRRRGWQDRFAIEADDLDEAELRYAAQYGGNEVRDSATDVMTLQKSADVPSVRRPLRPALGLFGYPGAQPR